MKKKFFIGIASLVLSTSIYSSTSTFAATQFTDVPTNQKWAEDAINYGVEQGYIGGKSDTIFGYGESLTRRDAAVLIASAYYGNREYVPTEFVPTFTDVSKTDSYAQYIGALQDLGVSGYTDGTFKPLNKISRAEFAALLANVFDLGIQSKGSISYSDVDYDDWFYPYVNVMSNSYNIVGPGNGKWLPNAQIKREEAAVFLSKLYKACTLYRLHTSEVYNNTLVYLDGTFVDDLTDEGLSVYSGYTVPGVVEVDGLEVLNVSYDAYLDNGLYVHTAIQEEGKLYHIKIYGQDSGLSFIGTHPQSTGYTKESNTQSTIYFNSPVDAELLQHLSLYSADNYINVQSAKLSQDGKSAILTTDSTNGQEYTILNKDDWSYYAEKDSNSAETRSDTSIRVDLETIDLTAVSRTDFEIDGLIIKEVNSDWDNGDAIIETYPQEAGKLYSIKYLGKDTGLTFIGGLPPIADTRVDSTTQVTLTFSSELPNLGVSDFKFTRSNSNLDENDKQNITVTDVKYSNNSKTITLTTEPFTPRNDYPYYNLNEQFIFTYQP